MSTNPNQHSGGAEDSEVSGEFIDLAGERYYAIRNVDKMGLFFISVISSVDHWLFASSNGGLTAGRVSPETALFPYITVDKIHDSTPHTGSKTIFRVESNGMQHVWEPFNREHDGRYEVSRNLYKSLLADKLCFEELNHDLQLVFRYTWATSDRYGFVRQCELQNLGSKKANIDVVDGLQNILPAGTPAFAQSKTSNLVDAYKWSELDASTGLAFLTLYSGITDRAEPSESLKATTVFCLGLDNRKVLVSSKQLNDFRAGAALEQENHRRGVRGAYLVNSQFELAHGASQRWQIVADIEQSQSEVVELRSQLANPNKVREAIAQSIKSGTQKLANIMARADGYQATAEENVTVHHYANVLFNVLRGGIFDDEYNISSWDFSATIRNFNQDVYRRNQDFLVGLPEKLTLVEVLSVVGRQGDAQLERLSNEYLPITFGRRHGDPSRPWNEFAINVKDEHGNGLISYQGNWRDVFQNWEALIFSYPGFVENVIAKFVNASTMDGYNPIGSRKRVSIGRLKNRITPGAILDTGVIIRLFTCRNSLNCRRTFIRTNFVSCCASLLSAMPTCLTASGHLRRYSRTLSKQSIMTRLSLNASNIASLRLVRMENWSWMATAMFIESTCLRNCSYPCSQNWATWSLTAGSG
jgi:hypothetical protein